MPRVDNRNDPARAEPRPAPLPREVPPPTSDLYIVHRLRQADLLTEDELNELNHQFRTESAHSERPPSILHLMERLAFPHLQEMLVFLSKDSGVTLFPLSRFDPQPAAYATLGLDYMTTNRVLAFDVMDRSLMVAVLNPYDTALREEVSRRAARKCFFYLVTATDYDLALSRIANTETQTPTDE